MAQTSAPASAGRLVKPESLTQQVQDGTQHFAFPTSSEALLEALLPRPQRRNHGTRTGAWDSSRPVGEALRRHERQDPSRTHPACHPRPAPSSHRISRLPGPPRPHP